MGLVQIAKLYYQFSPPVYLRRISAEPRERMARMKPRPPHGAVGYRQLEGEEIASQVAIMSTSSMTGLKFSPLLRAHKTERFCV